jgi:hypothetical protein
MNGESTLLFEAGSLPAERLPDAFSGMRQPGSDGQSCGGI